MNRPPYTRRRLGFVAVVAGVIAAVVLVASGGEDRPRRAQSKPPQAAESEGKTRPLRKDVGEVILMRFNGTRVPGYVQRVLRRGRATGVTLFTFNATSPAQLRTLTRQLQDAAG